MVDRPILRGGMLTLAAAVLVSPFGGPAPAAAAHVPHRDAQMLEGARAVLRAEVLFPADSDALEPEDVRHLRAVAADLLQVPLAGPVLVVGHTDDRGGAVHNLELSLRRADVVADVLQPVLSTAGVPVLADGRGQDEPRAANVGPDGREVPENQRLNRRVEITAVPATS